VIISRIRGPGSIQASPATAVSDHRRPPIDLAPVRLAPFGAREADAVAALRGEVVREGLLARLGGDARRAFFRVAARDPDTFGFVTTDETGVAGFVLVTAASRRLGRRTVVRHPRIWLRTMVVGLRSPSLVIAGLRRFRATGRSAPDPGTEVDPTLRLLDIAVSDRVRGRGHGRLLLSAAVDEAWRRGYPSIGLSVLERNDAAIRLYERAGFRRVRDGIRDDGETYLVMRLDRPIDTGPADSAGSGDPVPRSEPVEG
jgi:ribosomal protein S18 acetylase RimI-like enzyme